MILDLIAALVLTQTPMPEVQRVPLVFGPHAEDTVVVQVERQADGTTRVTGKLPAHLQVDSRRMLAALEIALGTQSTPPLRQRVLAAHDRERERWQRQPLQCKGVQEGVACQK